MSVAEPMPLARAAKIAEDICAKLAPLCQRVEVAGSIRRARPFVHDIDLVALCGGDQARALHARCIESADPLRAGPTLGSYRLRNGVQLDLYFAAPARGDLLTKVKSNWGSVMLCRTGSKEHNVMLAARAQKLGFRWKTGLGLCRLGTNEQVLEIVAGESEEEIFAALDMAWVPPAMREIRP